MITTVVNGREGGAEEEGRSPSLSASSVSVSTTVANGGGGGATTANDRGGGAEGGWVVTAQGTAPTDTEIDGVVSAA